MKLTIIKAVLPALTLLSVGALTSVNATAQDEIVIFKSSESNKETIYFQSREITYFDEELGEEVTDMYAGGKSKSSVKFESYIIFNKSTGAYREVPYYSYNGFDENNRKIKIKDFDNLDFDSFPTALFETDPDAKRNYLVASLFGTGNGSNFYFDDDQNNLNTSVLTETLEGQIKLQKIKTSMGTVECSVPSVLTGPNGFEFQSIDAEDDDRQERIFSTGKRTIRLDKRLTRALLEGEELTLEAGQAIVFDYLESKGYAPFGAGNE